MDNEPTIKDLADQERREEYQRAQAQRDREAAQFPEDPGGGDNICISCE